MVNAFGSHVSLWSLVTALRNVTVGMALIPLTRVKKV
jgi:hypothetical protein